MTSLVDSIQLDGMIPQVTISKSARPADSSQCTVLLVKSIWSISSLCSCCIQNFAQACIMLLKQGHSAQRVNVVVQKGEILLTDIIPPKGDCIWDTHHMRQPAWVAFAMPTLSKLWTSKLTGNCLHTLLACPNGPANSWQDRRSWHCSPPLDRWQWLRIGVRIEMLTCLTSPVCRNESLPSS